MIKLKLYDGKNENGFTYIYLILPIHLRLNLIYIAQHTLYNLWNSTKDNSVTHFGKIFGVGRSTITMRIKKNPMLVKSIIDKTNLSSVNEILSGKTHQEVANILPISRSRVSQIWGDFQNELLEKYNNGISKQTLIEEQVEKGINLTMESLNEIIPEDFNKLIIGDCLKELQIDKEIHTRPSPFKLWLFEYF